MKITSIDQVELLGRVGEKRDACLKLKIEGRDEPVLAPIIFERHRQLDSGLKTDSNNIGAHSPDCFQSLPELNGLYLCSCGRHILHVGDNSNPEREGEVYLRQVVVLP